MTQEQPPQLDPFGFWADRTVFVTGTTGFKGCWLARLLTALGAEVHGYSLPPPTEPSLYDLTSGATWAAQVEGDVRDGDSLRRAMGEAQPSVVLHLAAQSLVRTGHEEPIDTWDTNLMGTVHLLEAVRECPSVEGTVVVTTDKVYRDVEGPPLTEDGQLGGHGPYSASKAAAEIASGAAWASWGRASGRGIATARSGNTLGGGDWAAYRLVPDCVRAAGTGTSVPLRNPDAIRPWQHVLDALWGYVLLAEALVQQPVLFSRPWNFGPEPGGEPTVLELATCFAEGLEGGAGVVVEPQPEAPVETAVLRLDSTRSRRELGWRPALSPEACVDWTLRWYRRWMAGEEAADITREDLAEYLSLHR